MSTEPTTIPILELECMYSDCGNKWYPRTNRKPKVCPRCKRYGWETGSTHKRKGGRRNVAKTAHIGPETDRFLRERAQADAQADAQAQHGK